MRYLKHGCYPFYREGVGEFDMRLREVVDGRWLFEAEGRATQWSWGAGWRLRVESLFLLADFGRGEREGDEGLARTPPSHPAEMRKGPFYKGSEGHHRS